ncbi:uncharacterized protein METZ01_LOCUS385920 [marine metagenome]|uniref:Uncharacterized protein n=1 Tax=marine metagenome TaxID=408172 RepID=A0A382UFM6_9ZZZZ
MAEFNGVSHQVTLYIFRRTLDYAPKKNLSDVYADGLKILVVWNAEQR